LYSRSNTTEPVRAEAVDCALDQFSITVSYTKRGETGVSTDDDPIQVT
jgi:hypothetical protein